MFRNHVLLSTEPSAAGELLDSRANGRRLSVGEAEKDRDRAIQPHHVLVGETPDALAELHPSNRGQLVGP